MTFPLADLQNQMKLLIFACSLHLTSPSISLAKLLALMVQPSSNPSSSNYIRFSTENLVVSLKRCIFAPQNRQSEMKKSSVIKRLNTLKSQLAAVGVAELGLFGSTVREENTSKSDIDILLDFYTGQETYLNFMSACRILEENFKHDRIDVVTKKGLSPYIGSAILNEVEYV